MTFIEQSKKELCAVSRIITITDADFKATDKKIELLADESQHMSVSDFVDMCLSLIRVKEQ